MNQFIMYFFAVMASMVSATTVTFQQNVKFMGFVHTEFSMENRAVKAEDFVHLQKAMKAVGVTVAQKITKKSNAVEMQIFVNAVEKKCANNKFAGHLFNLFVHPTTYDVRPMMQLISNDVKVSKQQKRVEAFVGAVNHSVFLKENQTRSLIKKIGSTFSAKRFTAKVVVGALVLGSICHFAFPALGLAAIVGGFGTAGKNVLASLSAKSLATEIVGTVAGRAAYNHCKRQSATKDTKKKSRFARFFGKKN